MEPRPDEAAEFARACFGDPADMKTLDDASEFLRESDEDGLADAVWAAGEVVRAVLGLPTGEHPFQVRFVDRPPLMEGWTQKDFLRYMADMRGADATNLAERGHPHASRIAEDDAANLRAIADALPVEQTT